MATSADSCHWFPQAPTCGHGTRTTSCNFEDACVCDDGWTTDLSSYEAYLQQCNTDAQVLAAEQEIGTTTNRTISTTESVIVQQDSGAGDGTGSSTAIGFVCLALLALCLGYLYWRKRQKRLAMKSKTKRKKNGKSPYDEDQMTYFQPYMTPHGFEAMQHHPPPTHSPLFHGLYGQKDHGRSGYGAVLRGDSHQIGMPIGLQYSSDTDEFPTRYPTPPSQWSNLDADQPHLSQALPRPITRPNTSYTLSGSTNFL